MCGCADIHWISRTQTCTTLSTSETEYVGMANRIKQALFLRSVRRFRFPDLGDPCIQVFEDIKCAIQMAVTPVTNSNSKHIVAHHHFPREHVQQGEFGSTHVESKRQHVDFRRTPLPRTFSAVGET